MAASSAKSVSELSMSLQKERGSFSWSVGEVREIVPVCRLTAALSAVRGSTAASSHRSGKSTI